MIYSIKKTTNNLTKKYNIWQKADVHFVMKKMWK